MSSETLTWDPVCAAGPYLGLAACRPCRWGRRPPPPAERGSPSPWTPGCTANSRFFHERSASRSESMRRARRWKVKQVVSVVSYWKQKVRATKFSRKNKNFKKQKSRITGNVFFFKLGRTKRIAGLVALYSRGPSSALITLKRVQITLFLFN